MASNEPSNEVQPAEELPADVLQMGAPNRLTDSDLRNITDFDSAIQAAAAVHGEVVNFGQKYGTGFQPIDKSLLVEKTVVFVEWRFNSGTWGTFVSAVVVAKDGTKGIINDGSEGLRRQLEDITKEDGLHGGITVSHGLARSTYPICKDCGKPRPHTVEVCDNCGDATDKRAEGETYYLDMRE